MCDKVKASCVVVNFVCKNGSLKEEVPYVEGFPEIEVSGGANNAQHVLVNNWIGHWDPVIILVSDIHVVVVVGVSFCTVEPIVVVVSFSERKNDIALRNRKVDRLAGTLDDKGLPCRHIGDLVFSVDGRVALRSQGVEWARSAVELVLGR